MPVKRWATIGWFLLTPVCLCAQNRYAVLITEIMADPSPAVGLPAYEWIELKNTGNTAISLQHWRIADGTGQSGPLPAFTLQPDSMLIVCGSSALPSLSLFGTAVAVTGFPSLDNDGETLVLKTATGMTMHAVAYSGSWYQNVLKEEGGWTLEMIDPQNACSGSSNWKASTHSSGGTPGKRNSVNAANPDTEAPRLQRAFSPDSVTIVLVMDEPVDSLAASVLSNYSADRGLQISRAIPLPPLFQQIQLKLLTAMQAGAVYTISVQSILDCKGNQAATATATCGIAGDPEKGEWIINEILFNPRSNAYDYVELYNNSKKIFDASRLYIANRNSSGVISSIKALYPTSYFIFPGEHIVVTENAASLAHQYLVKKTSQVLTVSGMPSFPDEEGWVLALNAQGNPVDEVHYYDDWHFKLISNAEGVALERIDPSAPSQDAGNWHSAASTAGYGTPTYSNSQYKRPQPPDAMISITPSVFSPDNDGRDDVATLSYKVTAPGFLATVIIFDAAGRPVRNLVRNALMGLEGYWNWDGLDEKGGKLPVGTYIFYTEMFDLKGVKNHFKKTVVLARKL